MIFADSSYFVGLWNPSDPFHDDAVRIQTLMNEAGWARGLSELVTILPMAWEAGHALSKGVHVGHGLECFRRILNNCNVITPSERLVMDAFEGTYRLYSGVRRRHPGMIDSIGVAAMRRRRVLRIVSFDAGFDMVPDIRRITLLKMEDGYVLGLSR